jgi:hypothetical protein
MRRVLSKLPPMQRAPDQIALLHLYHNSDQGASYAADYDCYASRFEAVFRAWNVRKVVRLEVGQAGPGL